VCSVLLWYSTNCKFAMSKKDREGKEGRPKVSATTWRMEVGIAWVVAPHVVGLVSPAALLCFPFFSWSGVCWFGPARIQFGARIGLGVESTDIERRVLGVGRRINALGSVAPVPFDLHRTLSSSCLVSHVAFHAQRCVRWFRGSSVHFPVAFPVAACEWRPLLVT
jgi:hypothetical protein